jgi:hypothetical protein
VLTLLIYIHLSVGRSVGSGWPPPHHPTNNPTPQHKKTMMDDEIITLIHTQEHIYQTIHDSLNDDVSICHLGYEILLDETPLIISRGAMIE